MNPSIIVATAGLLLASCASSPSNGLAPSEPVRFTSEPSGALVTAANGRSCTTPCTLRFGTSAPAEFAVALEGYKTARSAIGVKFFAAGTALDAAGVASGDPVDMIASALFTARGKGNNKTLENHAAHIVLSPLDQQ